MILTALNDYTETCQRLDVSQRPVVYAAHYSHWDAMLGALSVPEVTGNRHLGRACHGVMSLFVTTSTVATSVCIVDALAPLGSDRSLFATRLTALDEGVNIAHWRIPYEMDDHGRLVLGPANPGASAPNAMFAACSAVASQRLSGQATYLFDEAWRASVAFLEMLSDGRIR